MTSPFIPKKFCRFCRAGAEQIDWRKPSFFASFVRYHGRIVPSRVTGNCTFHQKMLTGAIKKARHMALIPFVSAGVSRAPERK